MSGALDGKVAVVTGAGQGLGLAYARALARAGAAVVVNDANPDTADAAAASIVADGGRAVAVAAAVGPTEAADLLVRTAVEQLGRLDILVTNAGVLRDTVLWKMSDEQFDAVIATHLRGTFTTARAAAVHMRAAGEGGRIIVIGSPAGQHGNFGQTNYAAAKAGIVAMARTWSLELARAGITVNAVIPTALTAMTATIPVYAEVAAAFERGEPIPASIRRDHALGYPRRRRSARGVARLGRGRRRHRSGDRDRRRRADALHPSRRRHRAVPRRRVGRGVDRRGVDRDARRRGADLGHRAAADRRVGRPVMTTRRLRVEWVDTDASGRIHHTAAFRFAEVVEHELMRELGVAELTSFPAGRSMSSSPRPCGSAMSST